MNKTKTKISVVIPTYNSWDTLKSCLDSFQSQTLRSLEVIVVDNASTDGTPKKVRESLPKIRLFCLSKNMGATGGRNAGLKKINRKTDYILFFDHDMVAGKKMVEELVKVAEMDERIGIVTPKIYYWEDKNRIWSAGTEVSPLMGRVLFRGGKDVGQYEQAEEVQVAPAALLVKREVIDKIGGFNEDYFAVYEDSDLCFRARLNGFKIYYAPKAVAYHKLPTDKKTETLRLLGRTYWIGRNRVIFMKKYGKSLPVFYFFLPGFILYYSYQAIKYHRFKDGLNFLRGTIVGLFS